MKSLPAHIPSFLVEQLGLYGLFSHTQESHLTSALQAINALRDDLEPMWVGEIDNQSIILSRQIRNVIERFVFDEAMLRSKEFKRLSQLLEEMATIFKASPTLVTKTRRQSITCPSDLYKQVIDIGSKGITIQRYKGLGEMNPDQLWETTLNPKGRSLLRVIINPNADTDDIFSTLMGELVEPRRLFIQENALNVANLDI